MADEKESLERVGVSIEHSLIVQFDRYIQRRGYKNRSEAIRDMVREKLVEKQVEGGGEMVGTIVVVYDHHKRGLVEQLLTLQHDSDAQIVASQHVHLDHLHCLETIIVRGPTTKLEKLQGSIAALKGVGQCQISWTSCRTMH